MKTDIRPYTREFYRGNRLPFLAARSRDFLSPAACYPEGKSCFSMNPRPGWTGETCEKSLPY